MSTAPKYDFPESTQAPKSRTGCILLGVGGGCLVVVLGCAGIFGSIVFGVSAAIKSSEPYTQSLSRAQQHVAIQDALGQPIEASFFVLGNININNDDGMADLNYAISGPEGSATVRVVATKTDGTWHYQQMEATIDNDPTPIDLLD